MILGQEGDSEFVINRQNAKIQYLQKENNIIQEDVKDLQEALLLNKDALKLAHSNKINQQQSQTIVHENEAYTQEILEKQILENKKLIKTYKRCFTERNELATKNLLLSQVNEETAKFYKDVIHDLEEKILELRRIIQDKEYTIQTLEKKLSLPDKDGVLLKIKEIVTPNEQTIPLHSEIEKQKSQCESLTRQIKAIKSENDEIKSSNIALKHELIKIVSMLQSPINYQTMKNVIKNYGTVKEEDFYYIQSQKNVVKSILQYQQIQGLPEKQQSQQSNSQKSQYMNVSFQTQLLFKDAEQSFIKNFQSANSASKNSASQRQTNMKSPRSPQSRLDLVQKIETLETNQEKLKKLYFKSTKNAKQQFYNNLELKKNNQRQNLQIKTLQNSNRLYESKFRNLQDETDFFKEFFQNYMLDVQGRRRKSLDKFQKQKLFTKPEDYDQQQQGYDDDSDDKLDVLENVLDDLKDTRVENLDYLLEENYSSTNGPFSQSNVKQLWGKMKEFLDQINPEIEKIQKTLSVMTNSKGGQLRRNRSVSDPLVFFNLNIDEKRKLIKGWKKPKQVANRKSGKNTIINDKSSPFFVDMSVIGGPELTLNQTRTQFQGKKALQKQQQNGESKNNNQNQQQSFGNKKKNVNGSFISNEDEEILKFD